MLSRLAALAFAAAASAGTVLWDGRLNGYNSSDFLNNWSWGNTVGPYQYYIHGSGSVDEYVKLGADYKNPADKASQQGIQITIDISSARNSDGMLRTELIPQTSAPINKASRSKSGCKAVLTRNAGQSILLFLNPA
jgi:Glycoside hydrolase 131 catalytic N-terminal domain